MKITELARLAISRGEEMVNQAASQISQSPESFSINDIVNLKTGELQYRAGIKLIEISQVLQNEVLKILE